ncbi:MAG TPA: ABC transporter ATP-binding protein [Acidimicrobiales bacterium]|jgi:branched-chain amino acid transport system ATP-binding protein
MTMLEVRTVAVRFGGINALSDVSLDVAAGESVGLVGPNGAGKTTLFNCLLGSIKPSRGKITFEGRDLAGVPTFRRARLGLGRTFQRVELFAGMSAREHLLVAERSRRGDGSLLKDMLNRGKPRPDEIAVADETLALLGIGEYAEQPVESLTLGQSRLVELGRALVYMPKLLLLDEPSSGLDVVETLALAKVLASVRSERGTAILLVEHDLDLVRRAVDRLHVLDFGRTIAAGTCDAVLREQAVITAYLGVAAS